MQTPRDRSRWQEKLHHSAFFIGALLLHLVIFMLVATYVISPGRIIEPDRPMAVVSVPKSNPVPPPTPQQPTLPTIDAGAMSRSVNVIVATGSAGMIGTDLPPATIGVANNPAITPIPKPKDLRPSLISTERREEIRKNALRYRTDKQIKDHDATATFPIYVASYAKGDWSYNSHLDKEGNIVAGSVPDLAAKINEWSHGKITGVVVQKPLNIGGPELLDKHPPFIFFTGHRDFVLTDTEVENLRAYLQDGGAIWGDNALAGKGSRFDIAFRREMKRVVNKDFEVMPMDSAIFKKNKFEIDAVPAGINYHAEPIEHIDLDGVLAILYTPNDYNDLFAMRILPGDTKMQLGRPLPNGDQLTTNWFIHSHRNVVYRNFSLDSSLAVHRLGMNIVQYFITRFDDQLQLGF